MLIGALGGVAGTLLANGADAASAVLLAGGCALVVTAYALAGRPGGHRAPVKSSQNHVSSVSWLNDHQRRDSSKRRVAETRAVDACPGASPLRGGAGAAAMRRPRAEPSRSQ